MSVVQRNLMAMPRGQWRLLMDCLRFNWITLRLGSDKAGENMVTPKEDVVRFICDCFCASGVDPEHSCTVGHHLMTADYRGHFSHGMNRLQMYLNNIEDGVTDHLAEPEVVNDFQAVALVDGQNGLGHVTGKLCMKLAIKKAKKFGIGMVAARNSNHFGICAYYTNMAIKEELIGFACSNTSPLMVPTHGKKAGLGTNPLSLGMGTTCGDQFLMDMATTAVAVGKIELAVRKKMPIPTGWALGSDGKVTTDSEEALKASLLLPLGGTEGGASYKGYALALMVEVLCGILSGSSFGPNIKPWTSKEKRKANLGHCFMAINPEAFGCGSKKRLAKLLEQLRCIPSVDGKPVLVPGDAERENMRRVDEQGGIEYHPNQLQAAKDLGLKLNVEPLKLVPKKVAQ